MNADLFILIDAREREGTQGEREDNNIAPRSLWTVFSSSCKLFPSRQSDQIRSSTYNDPIQNTARIGRYPSPHDANWLKPIFSIA